LRIEECTYYASAHRLQFLDAALFGSSPFVKVGSGVNAKPQPNMNRNAQFRRLG